MAIKGGQILHDVNGYVIDRIQTGGPGQLNIPQEKVYELGNFNAVAIVRDIPDLSFDLESLDVSTEFESILLAQAPGYGTSPNGIDFANSVPIDVISPFKSTNSTYSIVKGLAVPCLTLERVTYRFGVRQNSVQQFTLRGDSIYYIPGAPHWEEDTYTSGQANNYTYSFPGVTGSPTAIVFTEQGQSFCTLAVMLYSSTTGAYKRLFYTDSEYTESGTISGHVVTAGHTGFTIPDDDGAYAAYDMVRFVYGSTGGDLEYTQSGYSPHQSGNDAAHKVHQGVSVKPAAVRGKDIKVYVGDNSATTQWTLFRGVQTAEVTRSVPLENDEELGNHHYVAQDYTTPDVTGNFGVKPYDAAELWNQISIITGVNALEITGPAITTTVPLKIEILDPEGVAGVLKTIYVPDARFNVPGLAGRANQKLETTFNFTSDGGRLTVYNGSM